MTYESKRALCQEVRSLEQTTFKELLGRVETEDNRWCSYYLLSNASKQSSASIESRKEPIATD